MVGRWVVRELVGAHLKVVVSIADSLDCPPNRRYQGEDRGYPSMG
jgi:hypothetical protein